VYPFPLAEKMIVPHEVILVGAGVLVGKAGETVGDGLGVAVYANEVASEINVGSRSESRNRF